MTLWALCCIEQVRDEEEKKTAVKAGRRENKLKRWKRRMKAKKKNKNAKPKWFENVKWKGEKWMRRRRRKSQETAAKANVKLLFSSFFVVVVACWCMCERVRAFTSQNWYVLCLVRQCGIHTYLLQRITCWLFLLIFFYIFAFNKTFAIFFLALEYKLLYVIGISAFLNSHIQFAYRRASRTPPPPPRDTFHWERASAKEKPYTEMEKLRVRVRLVSEWKR